MKRKTETNLKCSLVLVQLYCIVTSCILAAVRLAHTVIVNVLQSYQIIRSHRFDLVQAQPIS